MGNPPKMDGLYKIKSWKLVKMYPPFSETSMCHPSYLLKNQRGPNFLVLFHSHLDCEWCPSNPDRLYLCRYDPIGAGRVQVIWVLVSNVNLYIVHIFYMCIYIYYIIYVLYIAYNIYIYTHIMSDFSSLHGLYIYCSVDVPLIHIGCCFKRRLHKRAATIN